jgi:hypothetical protein
MVYYCRVTTKPDAAPSIDTAAFTSTGNEGGPAQQMHGIDNEDHMIYKW